MEDIVVQMLRFGKTKLIEGFTNQELIDHLTNAGFDLQQVTNTVGLYFSNYFAFNTTNPTIHFLKPNGYFDLLQIDNTQESRRQSKNANKIATIAIIFSGLLALSTILMTIYYVPTVKIKNDESLKNIIKIESQSNETTKKSK
jgi:hypothetical protein